MSVAPTSAASQVSVGGTGLGGAASSRLTANYDLFLQMLTTQLRVQNPLEPMNAEKFTEQLVQYSAVEQQIQMNQKLEDMLTTMVSSTALSLVNYIGKTVEAQSDTTQMKGGQATWKLDSAAAAKDAKVTIRNAAGAVVWEGETDLAAGENAFTWDGQLANGQKAPDGEYQMTVEAKDPDGRAVAVTTRVTGVVTEIDTSGTVPYIKVNGTLVPLSALRRVTT